MSAVKCSMSCFFKVFHLILDRAGEEGGHFCFVWEGTTDWSPQVEKST